jgi:DNA polymerase III epsilon subunit-like protein
MNYRTEVTGLQPAHFKYAPTFHDVRMTVLEMVADKILVGYNLWDFLLVSIDVFHELRIHSFVRLSGYGLTTFGNYDERYCFVPTVSENHATSRCNPTS